MKMKFCHKEYIAGEKVKIIETIISILPEAECAQGSHLQCLNWSIA